MEAVRERLVEILFGFEECPTDRCMGCEYEYEHDCGTCRFADYLIQNGVTLQDGKDIDAPTKWVSVDERLPEDGTAVAVVLIPTYKSDYVAYGIARYIDTSNGERHWYENHRGYLEWDKYSDGRGGCSLYKVAHWMPLPGIPKEAQ